MKINWGTGIFIFYTFFVGSLIFQVYKSTTYDHHLVTEDYYKQDLAYQVLYEKKQNSLDLKDPLLIQYEKQSQLLTLKFPETTKAVEGQILFYRADDKRQDVKLPIKLGEGNEMNITTQHFKAGYWNIEIDWTDTEKVFFDEKEIKI